MITNFLLLPPRWVCRYSWYSVSISFIVTHHTSFGLFRFDAKFMGDFFKKLRLNWILSLLRFHPRAPLARKIFNFYHSFVRESKGKFRLFSGLLSGAVCQYQRPLLKCFFTSNSYYCSKDSHWILHYWSSCLVWESKMRAYAYTLFYASKN